MTPAQALATRLGQLDPDPATLAAGRSIVIVGGGFCGAALAVHLLAARDPSLRITLVEPGVAVGRGLAYGTDDPEHLLNVPAIGMSIDPSAPDDFVVWARRLDPAVGPDSLLPRRRYGDYVQDRLLRAIAGAEGRLGHARTSATSVRPHGDRWVVDGADGRHLPADEVVLATGHGPTRMSEALRPYTSHPGLVRDPYAAGALARIGTDERVLVVGTGLTAADVSWTLRRRGGRGPITAVSRHGRWPRPHLATVRWTGPALPLPVDDAPVTADGLAAWFEDRVREVEARGWPWQSVFEAARPHVATLWSRLDPAERTRFLTEHRATWEIFRHRIPVETWNQLRAWRDEGWLRTVAGGLGSVSLEGDGFRVGLASGERLEVDRIVCCTGQESDPGRFPAPPWRELVALGLVVPDPHGLGVLTDDRGATLGADGQPTGLWALGGLQRPRWFESTAVPDLARQVVTLARALVPPERAARWEPGGLLGARP